MSDTDHTELSRTSVGDFLKLMGSELERTSTFLAKAAGPSLAAPPRPPGTAPAAAAFQLRAAPDVEATRCEPASAAAVAAPQAGPAPGAAALSSCRVEATPSAAPACSLPTAPTADGQAVVNALAPSRTRAGALQCPTGSSGSPAEVALSRSASFVRFQQQQRQEPQRWEAGPLAPASGTLPAERQLAQAIPMPPLEEMGMSRTTASSALSSSTCSLSTAICDGAAAGSGEFARLLQLLAPSCDVAAGVPSGSALDAPGQLGSTCAGGPLDLLAPAAQEPAAHYPAAAQPKDPTGSQSALPGSPPILPELAGPAGTQVQPTGSAEGAGYSSAVADAAMKPGEPQVTQLPCSGSGAQQLPGGVGALHPDRQAGATVALEAGAARPDQSHHKSRMKVLRWLRHSEGAQDCSPSHVPTCSHTDHHLFQQQQQSTGIPPNTGNGWPPPLAHAAVQPAPTPAQHWPHLQPQVGLSGLSAAAAAPLGVPEQKGGGRQGTGDAHLPGSHCAADRVDYCDQVAGMAPRQRSHSLVRLGGGPGKLAPGKLASSPLKLLRPRALPGGALERRQSNAVQGDAGAGATTAAVAEHRTGGLDQPQGTDLQVHRAQREQTLPVQQPSVGWSAAPGISIGSIHTAYFGGPAASGGGSTGPACQPCNPQPLQLQPGAAAQPGPQLGQPSAQGVAGSTGVSSPRRPGSSGCAAGLDMWAAYLASRRAAQRQQDELQNVDPADALGTLRQLSSRIKHMQGEITTFLVGSRQPLPLPDQQQQQQQQLLGHFPELHSGGAAQGEQPAAHGTANLAAFNDSIPMQYHPLQQRCAAAAAAPEAAGGGLYGTQQSNGSGGTAAAQSSGSRPGSAVSNRTMRSGRDGAIDRLKGLASLRGRKSGNRVYYDSSIPVVRIGSSRAK